MDEPVRAALALGAGGARGYAHIGVLEVLAERGVEVVGVAGSSMGALVGGLHAAGKLDGYTAWVRDLSHLDVLRLLDLSLTAPGVIRAEKIFARVHDLLGDVAIEDLPIPFTAVATDLFARKAVWFQRGPLQTAIRASIGMPGVFTPLVLNGRVLVDGGMIDPVPVAAVASVRADVTIAVDLGGERNAEPPTPAPAHETAEARPIEEWGERFRQAAANLLDRDLVRSLLRRAETPSATDVATTAAATTTATTATTATTGGDGLPAGLGRFDVMNLSLEAMQTLVTRYRLAGNPPDVLITVPKDACRTLDFHRANDMIKVGRDLAIAELDRAGVVPA